MRSSILDYKRDIAGIKVIRSRARRKSPIISPGIIPAALASSCKGLAMTIYITLRRGEAQVQYSNPLPQSVQELMPYQQHRRS